MQLTEQHEQLRDSVVRFVQNEINPFVEEWEKAEEFPSHEVFKKLGALGVLGVKYDEAYGGLGLDFPIPPWSLRRSACAPAAAFPWPSASSPTWRRPLCTVSAPRT